MNQCQKDQFNTLHRIERILRQLKEMLDDILVFARMCVSNDNVDLERWFAPPQIEEETGEMKPVEFTHQFPKSLLQKKDGDNNFYKCWKLITLWNWKKMKQNRKNVVT